jgi:hypothetical protein
MSLLGCGKTKNAVESYPIKISGKDSKAGSIDLESQYKLENYLTGDQTDTSKIQVINYDCGVFIYPTHQQIEEMKKEQGEDNFYVLADDSNFYQAQAIQILDSIGIKTVGTERQFLKFVGTESSWTLDIRKKNVPAWNLILFKKDKAPQPSPTIKLTLESARNYFEEK